MKFALLLDSNPSAMLDITETAARRSWSFNPKSRLRGGWELTK
jgi:hypothetical protein